MIESRMEMPKNMNVDDCFGTRMDEIFNSKDWKLESYVFQSNIAFSKMYRFSMDGSIKTALMVHGSWLCLDVTQISPPTKPCDGDFHPKQRRICLRMLQTPAVCSIAPQTSGPLPTKARTRTRDQRVEHASRQVRNSSGTRRNTPTQAGNL